MDERRQLPPDLVEKGQDILALLYGGPLGIVVALVLSVILRWVFPVSLAGAILILLALAAFYTTCRRRRCAFS